MRVHWKRTGPERAAQGGSARPWAAVPAVLGWLTHPVTVLALATLLVNDHVLKARYPGTVTGKASDVAGLVVAAPLLAVGLAFVAPRAAVRQVATVAVTATGALFLAMKASVTVASLISGSLSVILGPALIRADRSDLFALPALGVAILAARRSCFAVRRPPGRAGRWRPSPAVGRLAVVVVLPTAALAVAASSGDPYQDAAAVGVRDSKLFVGTKHWGDLPSSSDLDRTPDRWDVSEDGGDHWTQYPVSSSPVAGPPSPASSAPSAVASSAPSAAPVTATGSACVPGSPAHCYRIVPGHLRVEETSNGTSWKVAWQVSDRKRNERAEEWNSDKAHFSSVAIAVAAVRGGHVVVVANGFFGFVKRSVTGAWDTMAFPESAAAAASESGAVSDPSPAPQGVSDRVLMTLAGPLSWLPILVAGLVVALLAMGFGGGVALVRRRRGGALGVAVPLVGGVLLSPCILGATLGGAGPVLFGLAVGGLGALLAAVGGVGAVVNARRTRAMSDRRALAVVVVAVLSGVVCGCVMGWADVLVEEHRTAALLVLAAAVAGVTLAGLLGGWRRVDVGRQ